MKDLMTWFAAAAERNLNRDLSSGARERASKLLINEAVFRYMDGLAKKHEGKNISRNSCMRYLLAQKDISTPIYDMEFCDGDREGLHWMVKCLNRWKRARDIEEGGERGKSFFKFSRRNYVYGKARREIELILKNQ